MVTIRRLLWCMMAIIALLVLGCDRESTTGVSEEVPQVSAGADQEVYTNDTIKLTGEILNKVTPTTTIWRLIAGAAQTEIVSDQIEGEDVAPKDTTVLVYVFEATNSKGELGSDTVFVKVKKDLTFTVNAGRDTTVGIDESIKVQGSYTGAFPIVKQQWVIAGQTFSTPNGSYIYKVPSFPTVITAVYQAENSKGNTLEDAVLINVISKETLKVNAGPDATVQARKRYKMQGSYVGLDIKRTMWKIGDKPFEERPADYTFKVPSKKGILPCVFKVENNLGIEKSDTVLLNVVDTVRFAVDAGEDNSFFINGTASLQGSFSGEQLAKSWWKIGNEPFKDAPLSYGFKMPSAVSTIPCILKGQSVAGTIAYDTVLIDAINIKGIKFQGMNVKSEKPSKVSFTFSFRDEDGHAIKIPEKELEKTFKIYEKGQDVPDYSEIDYNETSFIVKKADDFKMDVCLVLDFTNSMHSIPGAVDTMVTSVKSVIDALTFSHKIAIVVYHDRNVQPAVILPMTLLNTADAKKDAKDALDKFVNSNYIKGSSRIWDAMYVGIDQFRNSTAKIKSIIALTDGKETSSSHSIDQVVNYAKSKRCNIHPIAFDADPDDFKKLENIADETGGAVYVVKNVNTLKLQYEQIAQDLGSQYSVNYISLRSKGTWRVRIASNFNGFYTDHAENINMGAISGDDRIGIVTVDTAEVNQKTANFSVYAHHIPRGIEYFDFYVNTKLNVTPSNREGLCKGWTLKIVDPDKNRYRLESTNGPIPFGSFGLLWEMQLSIINGSGTRAAFEIIDTGYGQGRQFVHPSYIIAGDGGHAPIAEAGSNVTVKKTDLVDLKGKGTDIDGKIVKYEWKFGNDPWRVTSTGDTTFSPQPQTFTCSLRVTDDDGLMGYDAMRVTVLTTPPTVSVVADTNSVKINTPFTLNATAQDPDGSIVKKEWKIGSGTWIETLRLDTVVTPTEVGYVNCYMRVTDDDGLTATSNVTRVNVFGKAPVIDFLRDTVIVKGDPLFLTAKATDSDGNVVKHEWKISTSISGGTFVETSIPDTTITIPATTTYNYYYATYRATDNDGLSTTSNRMKIELKVAPNPMARKEE